MRERASVKLLVWVSVAFLSVASGAVADDDVDLSIEVDAYSETDYSSEIVSTGGYVTYTITVVNSGTVAAPSFNVLNFLPDETTFFSCTSTAGGICGGSGLDRTVWFNTLAPGATATISIGAGVGCSIPAWDIVNTAEIQPDVADPEADANDNDSASMTVVRPSPLPSALRKGNVSSESVRCPMLQ